MQLLRRHTSRSALFAGFAGIALLAAACTDRANPVGPGPGDPGGPGGPVGPPAAPVTVQALLCITSRAQKTVTCAPEAPANSEAQPVIIVGPNGKFVDLTSSNVNYDGGTQQFTFDVTIRNRIPQPLGTADTTGALAPDPNGVRIFFRNVPTVTSGTGAISVDNEDGEEVFLNGLVPYYQYNTVLEQYEVSAPKTWQFSMPPSVNTFQFQLLISTAVPRPNGYITLDGNPDIRPGFERQLAPTVRFFTGEVNQGATQSGTFTWFSSDSTRAKVDSNGLVKGLRFGSTAVGVETTLPGGVTVVSGKIPMNVRRTRRHWTGAIDTNWNNPGNWQPATIMNPADVATYRVVPEAQDTAVVPAAGAISNFPVLIENENIGGVEVFQGSIALNAFNLTATGSVVTVLPTEPNPTQITSTSGQLVLAGIAQTVRGTLPRLLVTGTYSLNGNITVMQRIRVQSGRLRNQTFRIRQIPN